MPDGVISILSLQQALQRLGELAAAHRLFVELVLCHGAVIVLAYAEPASDRVRAVERSSRVVALAQQVAAERQLPPDWIDEEVRYYLALENARHRLALDRFGPHLTLAVSEPERPLAIKLEACRDGSRAGRDVDDLRVLLGQVKPASPAAATAIHARYFPGRPLAPAAVQLVAELLPAVAGLSS